MRRSSFARIRAIFEQGGKPSSAAKQDGVTADVLPTETNASAKAIKRNFHTHSLVWNESFEHGHLCEFCFEFIATGGWRCAENCGFELCKACVDIAESPLAGPSESVRSHPHSLRWNSAPSQLNCSECQCDVTNLGVWWCTQGCTWGLCSTCFLEINIVNPVEMGVSLKLLNNVSEIFPEACGIDYLCRAVKDKTVNIAGYRSFAMSLYCNPYTRRFVRAQADVFVSYAWKGGIKSTIRALKSQLLQGSLSGLEDDVFIWMDVVIVDQHAAATTDINFDQWAATFRGNLLKTKKAMLVLTPARCPIAITRSWCVFEWVCIVESGIPYAYCVDPSEVRELVEQAKNGLKANFFVNIFARINVERATAFKEYDQRAILGLLRKTGDVKVNDVVMKSIKNWLMSVLDIAEAEAHQVDNRQQLIQVLLSKGQLHFELGDLRNAETYFRQALGMQESMPGSLEHPQAAVIINNIAIVITEEGKLTEALVLYERALSIWERAYGRNHIDVGTAMSNLACLHMDQGNFVDAEPLMRDSLAVFEALYGPKHPDVATALNNLASLLQKQGKLKDGEELLRQSLSIQLDVFGPDHPALIASRHNLSSILEAMSRWSEAESLHRESLNVLEKVYGRKHVETARTLNSLAYVLNRQRQFEESETLYRECLAIREAAYGMAHPNVAITLNNLAGVLEDQGKFDQAETTYRAAIRIMEQTCDADHPHLKVFLANLERLLVGRGKAVEAQLPQNGDDKNGEHSAVETAATQE